MLRVDYVQLNRIKIWFLATSFICILCSCVEPTEGCLDARASNFAIAADADCCRKADECCCSYPSMTLNLFYKLRALDTLESTETNFQLGQYYALENKTDSIRIDSFHLFVSNLGPRNSNLESVISVRETISTRGATAEQSYEDNIALVDLSQFRYTLGTYQSDLTYDAVSFNLGLSDELSLINPEEIVNNNHPLADEYLFLFDDSTDSYKSLRIKYSIKRDAQELDFTQSLDFKNPLTGTLLIPKEIEKGNELRILMRINVLDVFKGIIFDTSQEDIGLIINENLIESVSILE